MASHHFIGTGAISAALADRRRDPVELTEVVSGLVTGAGLAVVGHQSVRFANEGLTVVWVLAESHLVMHLWPEQGYATLDLHVCDYTSSNRAAARALVAELTRYCFVEGSAAWQEVEVEPPGRVATTAIR
jgi:S-adenosylmethionine decarboxylase